ncbi:TetR/AcrR family transcriptional regulator [Bacillus mycoides]|nr:TetR/AcrR family transcriptional regulator [Bacillus mycoides]QWG33554.1 TetR/AcrR family transcriptional regulator [Bacillus mycoides]
MEKSYTDLRIARTKEAIRAALTELINEKGFDSITVKDITARANINRGTFYLHYRDKYDLLEKCEKEIMRDIVEIEKQGISTEIVNLEDILLPFPFVISVFEYVDKHGEFMNAVLGPKGDISFQIKLKDFMWENLFKKNIKQLIKRENLLVPDEYLSHYIASAHLGVIQRWLQRGRKESPKEMARILSTITVNGPYFAAGLKR